MTKNIKALKISNMIKSLAIILLIVLGISSCEHGNEDKNNETNKNNMCKIRISTSQYAGTSRSAHPIGAYPDTWYWQVTANEFVSGGSGTGLSYTSEKVQLASDGISLTVEAGKVYTFILKAYNSNSSDAKVLLSGIKKEEIPANSSNFQLKIGMSTASAAADITGSISLNLNFSGVADFKSVDIVDTDGLDSSKLDLTETTSGSHIYTLSGNNIRPNTYTFKLEVEYTATSKKNKGIFYVRDVVVEPERETNKWTGVDELASDTYVVNDAVVMGQEKFHVGSTVADSSAPLGSQLNPFNNLQEAVNKCSDSNVEYTIYVLDTIENANACAEIEGDKKIKLIGYDLDTSDTIVPKLDAKAKGTSETRRVINTKKDTSDNVPTLYIKDLIITGGRNELGAALLLGGGTVTIDGTTEIFDNEAMNKGGAVYMNNSTKLIMESGTITGNTAKTRGAGVFIGSGSFTMRNSSSITGNTVRGSGSDEGDAGGVYVGSNDTFVMEGGTISGNIIPSGKKGSAVYVDKGSGAGSLPGKFHISGTAKVGTDTDNNLVYLASGAKIILENTLNNNPVATIEVESYDETNQVLAKVTSLTDEEFKTQVPKFKVKDDGTGKKWAIDTNGKLHKKEAELTLQPSKTQVQLTVLTTDGNPVILSGTQSTTSIPGDNFSTQRTINSSTAGGTIFLKGDIQKLRCVNDATMTNNLEALDLSVCSNLEVLQCFKNNLKRLDISNSTKLKSLGCQMNQLESLTIPNAPDLEKLYCHKNKLDADDFIKILNALPDRTGKSQGQAILYDKTGGVLETGNYTDFQNFKDESGTVITELETAFNNAKSRNWKLCYKDGVSLMEIY